jgi:hypothetical protein
LQGVGVGAADQARGLLMERIDAIAAEGRLGMAPQAAADLAWASAHAAAMLYMTAVERQPDPIVVESLRDSALQCICTPRMDGNLT